MDLPCGCSSNRYCPEGKRLNDAVMQAWRELQHLPPDDPRWQPYDDARDKFDIHMGNQPVGCRR